LQADAEREHGNQGGHTDGDADRRQRIAEDRLTQIADGQVDDVVGFHFASPCCPLAGTDETLDTSSLRTSLTSLPSARCNIRPACFSARANSCVTMSTVIPNDWLKLRMSSMISVPVRLSRLPVG